MALPAFPPENIASWLTPRQAIELLDSDEHSTLTWRDALLERLRGDMVASAARDVTLEGPNVRNPSRQTWALLGARTWRDVTRTNPMWNTGDLTLTEMKGAFDRLITRCFDVRFNPDDLQKMLPPAPSQPEKRPPELAEPKAPPATNKGGRPPKAWWQDFWIEMCRLVYTGDIQPEKTQADVQRLMEQWVSDHNHKAGETVIKDAAKKLMIAIRK